MFYMAKKSPLTMRTLYLNSVREFVQGIARFTENKFTWQKLIATE